MDLSNRYLYLFTCFILSIVFNISSASAATDISYTANLDKSTKTIKLDNVVKNGLKQTSTSIKVTPNVVASSMKKRLAAGGGSLILVAAAYYGMQYNQDNGVFEKEAEQGQWQWSYQGLTSSSASEIANAVINYNNSNQTQFTYSAPTTSINGSGALAVKATRTDKSSGATKEVTLASIGGSPNVNPAPIEVYSIDQVANALINDAFAIEGSDYFPSLEQVTKAGDALLDLYGVTRDAAVQHIGGLASDATDGIKSIYAALVATQPLSQETDIKAPAVPDAGVIGSLPDFCSWATPVCNAISSIQSFFNSAESPCPDGDYSCFESLKTTDIDTPVGVGLDSTMFAGSSMQCPPDHVVSVAFLGNKTFSFSYQPLCSFAVAVNPIVILIGYLVAGFIFINSLRTM